MIEEIKGRTWSKFLLKKQRSFIIVSIYVFVHFYFGIQYLLYSFNRGDNCTIQIWKCWLKVSCDLKIAQNSQLFVKIYVMFSMVWLQNSNIWKNKIQKIGKIDNTVNSFLRKMEIFFILINSKGVSCNFHTTMEFCAIFSNHEGFCAINSLIKFSFADKKEKEKTNIT